MTGTYDLGAVFFVGAFVLVPAALRRLERVRLRHGIALWVLGWATGIVIWLRGDR